MRLLSSFVLFLSGLAVFGQMNTGEISGSVQDLSGGVLPNARIVAHHIATGQDFPGVSNRSGEYSLVQLPAGLYSLNVSASNFKQALLPNLEIHASDRLRYNFTLEVGERTDVVTIVDEGGGAQLEAADIRDVVGREQVTESASEGAPVSRSGDAEPGRGAAARGTRGDAMQQAGNLVNVLGQRSGHNLYLMDGVAITDEHFNNMVIAPSVDAIEEFNIEKTSYAPEFGGKSGAVINVVSRSGSNSFHGSLFEFVRNSVFDAKNFFDSAAAPIPPFRQNQFGAKLWRPDPQEQDLFLPEL